MNNFATVLCRTEGSVKICSHGSVPLFLFALMENLLSSVSPFLLHGDTLCLGYNWDRLEQI